MPSLKYKNKSKKTRYFQNMQIHFKSCNLVNISFEGEERINNSDDLIEWSTQKQIRKKER